jgi:acetylglutamate kinase
VKTLQQKAAILVEALPYLRQFRDKTVVIKYGGAAQVDEALKESFAQDIALLEHVGLLPIVVHGGGREITHLSERLGLPSEFVDGQRVTTPEVAEVAEMVLSGKVNGEIVTRINQHGAQAVGLSGKDGFLLRAERWRSEKADLGQVGRIVHVEVQTLRVLLENEIVPVIAPIGVGPTGETLNINADLAACEIAKAIQAEKLVFLSDVEGVVVAGKRLSTVTTATAQRLIEQGKINGGMVPKVKAALDALGSGVRKVHLIDGRIPHSLLLEIFTQEGIGTQFLLEEQWQNG